MPAIRQTRDVTHRRILAAVAEAGVPVSLKDIQFATGYNYYTVREHVSEALNNGTLEKDDRVIGRTAFFRVPDNTKTPKFSYLGVNEPKKSMLVGARSLGNTRETKFSRAVGQFANVHAFLYQQAARVGRNARLTQRDLTEGRQALIQVKATLETHLNIVNQMLEAKALWDPNSLADILLNDPEDPITPDEADLIAANIKERWA